MSTPLATRTIEQYQAYPYPSLPEPGQSYTELENLMKLLQIDCGYSFQGRKVLDIGTGTGVRLLQLAKSFPENQYTGIDVSSTSIAYAIRARQHYSAEVEFLHTDIDNASPGWGQFDVVLCMGVLHHLENPGDMIASFAPLVKNDGMALIYLYGVLGSAERMRRKRVLEHLHPVGPLSAKIESAKLLGFIDFPYGWQLRNRSDMDAMIVDAYANQYEELYTLEKFGGTFDSSKSEFHYWSPYGFALEKHGVLVESRIGVRSRVPIPATTPAKMFTAPQLLEQYVSLPKRQQLMLLESWYAPGGYTILLRKPGFLATLARPDRLVENSW